MGLNIAQAVPAKIAAGDSHALAIMEDGTLWAWGGNANGQLGDGTTNTRSTPYQIGNSTDWIDIEAGGMYTPALRSNGTLWAWGDDSGFQQGRGTPPQNKIVLNTKETLSTTSMDFGAVVIGNTSIQSLRVLNNSSNELPEPAVSVSNYLFNATKGCNSVGANDSSGISVSFAPVDGTPASGSLTVDGRNVALAGIGITATPTSTYTITATSSSTDTPTFPITDTTTPTATNLETFTPTPAPVITPTANLTAPPATSTNTALIPTPTLTPKKPEEVNSNHSKPKRQG